MIVGENFEEVVQVYAKPFRGKPEKDKLSNVEIHCQRRSATVGARCSGWAIHGYISDGTPPSDRTFRRRSRALLP